MQSTRADRIVVRRGAGRPVLLIHGSAADHATWLGLLARPPPGLSVIAYDRRGSGSFPLAAGTTATTQLHAADAIELAGRECPGQAVLLCGSSYGAVVALEVARAAPGLVAGLVLCEPPLPAADLVPYPPPGFGCAFDRLVATAGGPAAGAMFLRVVLGDAAFDAMQPRLRSALCGMWRSIRADLIALARTRVVYGEIGAAIRQPCLLVGGERSPPDYTAPLDQLARVLPDARRVTIPAAGHAMQVDNHREFRRAVVDFAVEIGFLAVPP